MAHKHCKETARLEHCEHCGSTEMKNNMYFCKGENIKVYVECAKCGRYVTRYTLSGYTSNKTYESLLRKFRFLSINSGKRTKQTVESFGKEVEQEFGHVRDLIRTQEDERRIEEIIETDYREGLD
ncbi:MAG: hypothetical protein JXB45_12945 [Candidatus Krumholzibacteriota bacterium]|nr:hypothetical protein [Candidatus Krumholzibacteriota bacterium]